MIFHGQASEGAKKYSLDESGFGHQLSPHFALGEMACNDGSDRVLVHPQLVALLEQIRCHFDERPVIINSGYRTPSYNRHIGGVSRSKHLLGMAADIRTAAAKPSSVAAYAREIDAGGVGQYATFTHVDVYGRGRRWRG